MNEATCSLLGKLYNTGDLEIPRGISPLVEERYYMHAPDCSSRPQPVTRVEDGEMFTAREQKGDVGRRRSLRRRVALVKPKVNTCFAQVTRPARQRRQMAKRVEDATPSLESTPKSSRTHSMSMLTTSMEGALRWNEEESDASHVPNPMTHIPHLATSPLIQVGTPSTRVSALEKEVMALKDML